MLAAGRSPAADVVDALDTACSSGEVEDVPFSSAESLSDCLRPIPASVRCRMRARPLVSVSFAGLSLGAPTELPPVDLVARQAKPRHFSCALVTLDHVRPSVSWHRGGPFPHSIAFEPAVLAQTAPVTALRHRSLRRSDRAA